MVSKFSPEIGKVYFNNEYCLYQILSGHGPIEVDFKQYTDWDDKIIYLSKGQYIKFYTDNFVIRKITFTDEQVFKNKEFRVLFKHLISLGYINFKDCEECQAYLQQSAFATDISSLIDVSSAQWYWQNPFNANKDEYHVIFDVKDIIDKEFQNRLSNHELASLLNDSGQEAMAIVKDKVGITVRNLLHRKRFSESQKALAFTDRSIKEIAYEMGYKDPAYFNRDFKNAAGKNPSSFRKDFGYESTDHFVSDLIELIRIHHTNDRSLEFYADKFHLSVKTLSRKVKSKLNASLSQLIRSEVINTSKTLLSHQLPIKEIANRLSFEEPNHFTSFFKHYTGKTPSQFISEKCKS